MKKPYKIIIALALIFSFSATLIFCCTFQEAQASSVDHCDHDQSEKADHQQDSHSSHNCMCQQTFVADFSKSFNPGFASAHFFKKFFKNDMAFGGFVNFTSFSHSSLLPERSPPLIAAISIPIYLKHSNLRL